MFLNSLTGKVFLTLFFIGALISGVSAADASVSFESHDKNLWLNENSHDKVLDGTATCSRMVNGTQEGDIDELVIFDSYSNPQMRSQNVSTHQTDFTFDAATDPVGSGDQTGKYFIKLECSDGTDTVEQFYIDRLNVEIKSADDRDFYLGTSDKIQVELSSPENRVDYSSFDEVKAIIGADDSSVDETVLGSQQINFGSTTEIQVQEIPDDITSLDSLKTNLDVTTAYEENKDNGITSTWIETDREEVGLERWDIIENYKPGQRVSSEMVSEINLSLQMSYEGKAVDSLDARHFYLKRGERNDIGEYEWFSGGLKRTTNDGRYGVYSLALEKMPQLDVGDHTLDIWFESEEFGPKKIGTVYVEKKFDFEGRVSDSNSRAIDATFNLDSGEYFEKFSTDSRGFFSRRVMPGTYGFDIDFPQGSLSLSEVELDRNYSAEINHEYFSDPSTLDLDVQGVEPINMMAISFGYPFERGSAKMRYNPAKTDDPMNVDVYECVEWNFWGQKCISGWSQIDDNAVTLPPTKWIAEFPVTPVETSEYGEDKNVLFSAYMVGKIAGMRVSRLALDDYKVPVNGDFTVSGNVVTDGNDLQNADVQVTLEDNGRTVKQSSGKTDGDGRFEIDMSVDEPGNFTVNVNAEKGSYEPFNMNMDDQIWVYEEKELNLDLTSQLSVTPGETSTTELTVNNEGQTTFNDITLSVDGPTLTDLSRSQFSSIEAGSSETVNMNVTLPGDFCDPSCAQYPTYTVSLKGNSKGTQVNEDYELRTVVQQTQPDNTQSQEGSETDEQNDGQDGGESSNMDFTTPDFIQSQSSLNIALGLIIVFSLALAGAVKKKKSDSTPAGGRETGRAVNLQRPQVAPSNNMQEDEKIKAVAEGISAIDEDEVDEDENIDELAAALDGSEQSDHTANDDEFLSKIQDHESGSSAESGSGEAQQVEKAEGSSEEGQESDHVCDVCGESFDSASGLKLHKQALH